MVASNPLIKLGCQIGDTIPHAAIARALAETPEIGQCLDGEDSADMLGCFLGANPAAID